MVLSGHLIPGLNPRLGNMANIPILKQPPIKEGGIWISVYQENHKIMIATSDRETFSYSLPINSIDKLKEFSSYLKKKTLDFSISANLNMEANLENTKLSIAVDKDISYHSFRPILYALAKARISKYSFETLIVE